MEKEYYDAQVKYINEIRSIRHDIQAHMVVLQYYLESENYEKAKAYLSEMRRHQDMHRIVVKDTGNDLVNAIVSDTLSRSEKKILFEMKGLLPIHFVMTDYDVCTLFSNIFSNALEACEKLADSEPMIFMEVQENDEECRIAVQNPIAWKIQTDATGFVTTKKDGTAHGIGTKNMIKVAKKYGGKIDFLVTDTSFRVEICLKYKQ